MKRKNALRSLACFLLCAVLLMAPLSVLAAGQATAGISAKIYDGNAKKFVTVSDVQVGQIFYIPVTLNGNRPAMAFAIALQYDKALLDFMPGSSISLFTESTEEISTYTNDSGAAVVWESGITEALSGEVYYAAFRVKNLSETVQATVELTVTQLLDGDYEEMTVSYGTKQVSLQLRTNTSLSAEELAPFQKLATITYPASKADIEAADAAFRALGSQKQQILKQAYQELYQDYITAWSRYNRLVDEAAEQAVLDELAAYANAHAEVLKLTPETVQMSHSEAVAAARKALKNEDTALSQRAAVLLNRTYAELLDSLQEAIEEQEYIQSEIDGYKEAYANLFNLDEKTVQMDLESYLKMLEEAISVYDGKPDAVKEALKEPYASMVKMRDYCKDQLALEDASEELTQEVGAYQAQWLDVLLLNTATVTEGDETAIRMALAAYNGLSPEAKAQLEPKIKNLEALLLLIEGMKEQPGEGNNGNGNGGNSGNAGGQTQTVIVEKDKLVEKNTYMPKTNPTFLIVLIVLVVLSVGSFVLTVVLGALGKKKHQKSAVKEDAQ